MGFFHVSIFIYIKKSWEKWLCSTSTQVTSGKRSRNTPSISPSLQYYIQMSSQLFALEMLHLPTPMWHLQMQISDGERCWLLLLPPFRCGSYWTFPAQTCRQQTYGVVDSLWNNLLGVLRVFQKSLRQRCPIFSITFLRNAKLRYSFAHWYCCIS